MSEESVMQLSQIDFSNPMVIAVIAVAVLAIILVIALVVAKRKKDKARLRERFGAEYDRTVLEQGSEAKAAEKLAEREARVEKLKIVELSSSQRERYIADWTGVQSRFLDHPKGALMEADELVASILTARGYAGAEFERAAEDVSVAHPRVVQEFRSAHATAVRTGRGEASTEEMRTAMLQYRSLFDELVGAPHMVRAAG
jgi:hypothetical protein